MGVVIKEVTSKKELKKFVKFNIDLYKDNPYHIPGLIEEEMVTLDKKKNPAFEVCDAIYFLAYKDGKIVGRIAGMINRRSNEVWNQQRARFGFLDFIDDKDKLRVFPALFHTSCGRPAIGNPRSVRGGNVISGIEKIGCLDVAKHLFYNS